MQVVIVEHFKTVKQKSKLINKYDRPEYRIDIYGKYLLIEEFENKRRNKQ